VDSVSTEQSDPLRRVTLYYMLFFERVTSSAARPWWSHARNRASTALSVLAHT
jgi:hypothetical protein